MISIIENTHFGEAKSLIANIDILKMEGQSC